ncbi:MAG TPA: chemotaxis protein CheA [Nitrospirae bacterium]|nr:chemotaxis protein CheA [Nitrospirota bacterium]
MSDEMEEIIQDFIIETQEILDALDEKFVDLEKDRSNQDLLNEIFRSIHTLKGASGFLGYNQLVELTHTAENILKKLKDGILQVTPHIMDVILDSVDLMKLLLEHIKEKDGKEEDLNSIVSKLQAIEKGESTDPGDGARTEDGPPAEEEKPVPGQTKETETITPDENSQASPQKESNTEQEPSGDPPEKEKVHVEQTLRVDIERLDNVLNLVGELVLGRNRLMKITSNLETRHPEDHETSMLSETTAFLSIITTDLQIAVMKTRMQPMKKVFNKFPRMVRDLARSRGKEVELIISGEETEVDKSVIENIADPLVHLVRNALDHGIELPEERQSAGKPAQGTVKFSASQEGNNIVIEIEDNGRGMDPDIIRQKAVEKEIITQPEAMTLSGKEVLDLLFTPGFSTANEITDISGRGVGMDVVKTNISKLNGTIEILTEKGKGSRFIIRFPLTLAIIQTLMVEAAEEVYAIPLGAVLETVRVTAQDIHTVNSQEVIQLRGEVLPIIRLAKLFGTSPPMAPVTLYVVVATANDKKFGLAVDRLKGQEEAVIKAVEGNLVNLNDTNIIAGATIAGDGRVVLIIDVSIIMESLATGTLTYA